MSWLCNLWGRVSLLTRASDSQSEKVGLNPACILKQGTSSYLLHLWTEMQMVVPSPKLTSSVPSLSFMYFSNQIFVEIKMLLESFWSTILLGTALWHSCFRAQLLVIYDTTKVLSLFTSSILDCMHLRILLIYLIGRRAFTLLVYSTTVSMYKTWNSTNSLGKSRWICWKYYIIFVDRTHQSGAAYCR